MQRREVGQLAEHLLDAPVDAARGLEPLAAVHDPMSDRVGLAQTACERGAHAVRIELAARRRQLALAERGIRVSRLLEPTLAMRIRIRQLTRPCPGTDF